MKKSIVVIGFLMAGAGAQAEAANIVQNGGFENGTVGWVTHNVGPIGNSSNAHSGLSAVQTGCVGHACVSTYGSGSYITQTLNTTEPVAYTLSFWVGEEFGATSEFSVWWNGTLVADVLNPANYSELLHPGHMVQFTYTGLLASGAQTVLEINGRDDPGDIFFDDVSVTANVGEPGTAAVLFGGLLGLAAIKGRRQRGLVPTV